MDSLVFLLGFIVICFIVILVAGFFERKIKRKNTPPVLEPESSKEPMPEFVEGRIYQMEDGSFAKYVGNGKFMKIKQ